MVSTVIERKAALAISSTSAITAPTGAELTALAQRFAQRVGRYLERQGLLQRGAQTSYLAGEAAGASRSLLMTRTGLVFRHRRPGPVAPGRADAFLLPDYHHVLHTRRANLSLLMRHINGVYTQAFNRRHNKVGHRASVSGVFQSDPDPEAYGRLPSLLRYRPS
jgi:hypothetical protein